MKGINLIHSTLTLLKLIHDDSDKYGATLSAVLSTKEKVLLAKTTFKQLCLALDECRQQVDLVQVVWGEDQGVVSLKQRKVLFYCYGDIQGASSELPRVTLADDDFAILANGFDDTPLWDDVVALLNDVRFDLMGRIDK